MTIWRMRIACCITKATHALTVCDSQCFSAVTVVARRRLNITIYVQCLCCWFEIWDYEYVAVMDLRILKENYFQEMSCRNKVPCNLVVYLFSWGTAVAQLLRCCATNRKVAGSIPDGVIGIFH